MGRGRRESRQMKGCDRRPWAWEEAHLCLSQEAGATQHGWHSPCLWFSLGSAPHWATRVGPLVPQTCPRQAFPKPSCLGFPDGSQCPRPHLHCCLQKLGSSLLTLSPCSAPPPRAEKSPQHPSRSESEVAMHTLCPCRGLALAVNTHFSSFLGVF